MPANRLRAADLAAPFRGARSLVELDGSQRLRLLCECLPAHAFACGPTAAVLHRLPLPHQFERDAYARPTVGVAFPHNRIRRIDVVGRVLRLSADEIVANRGIRCTSVTRTWVDMSGTLPLAALVALTDRIIFHRAPLATLAELRTAANQAKGIPGVGRRVQALELCNERAESPRESELRVLVVTAGLGEPECNAVIRDSAGRFVARVDLLYRDCRLILEYDGDYHRDPAQWSRDQSRRAELESLGYRVSVVTARDFDNPAALVRRIRRLQLRAASNE